MEVAGLRGTPDQPLPSQGKVEDLLIDYHSVFMDQSLKHRDTSRDTTFGSYNGHLVRTRTVQDIWLSQGPVPAAAYSRIFFDCCMRACPYGRASQMGSHIVIVQCRLACESSAEMFTTS